MVAAGAATTKQHQERMATKDEKQNGKSATQAAKCQVVVLYGFLTEFRSEPRYKIQPSKRYIGRDQVRFLSQPADLASWMSCATISSGYFHSGRRSPLASIDERGHHSNAYAVALRRSDGEALLPRCPATTSTQGSELLYPVPCVMHAQV
jgi:hypothetical protein